MDEAVEGRQKKDVARLGDLVPVGELLELDDELGRLAGEDHRRDNGWNQDEERPRQRHEQGRETPAPAEGEREPSRDGRQEKGEEPSPEDGLEEGLEDAQEGHRQQRGRGQPEHPRVKVAVSALCHAAGV